MAASPSTSQAALQLRSDLQIAKRALSEGPRHLADARAHGRSERVGRIERQMAWAQALLTKHGQVAGPPPPAPAAGGTSPAELAARHHGVPGTASRREPASGHTPSPPKGQAPMTTQATTDALWGEAIAGLNATDGLTTASPSAAQHDQVPPARRVETGAGASGTSTGALWGAAVADVNAENGLTPQTP